MASQMSDLEHLYKAHRSIPFPPSHDNPEIQEVHNELVVYDADIAGYVSRILDGDESARNRLWEDPALRKRIADLRAREKDAEVLLDRYLEEYDRLVRMVRLARRQSK